MNNDVPPGEETPLPIFASFRYGADNNRTPDLHATVFLFNTGIIRDGAVQRYSTNQFREHKISLQAVYEVNLHRSLLLRGVGPVLPVQGMDLLPFGVPNRLCLQMTRPQGMLGTRQSETNQQTGTLSNGGPMASCSWLGVNRRNSSVGVPCGRICFSELRACPWHLISF